MEDRLQIETRGAIEALRAGVPNRAAIRLLGERDGGLVNSFLELLRRCTGGFGQGRQSEGNLVWGGFGSGKSHLLGYMRELALQRNFVVSLVPVSKETPMFDPARLFAAAIRAAEVPGANDDVMTVALSAAQSRDGALRPAREMGDGRGPRGVCCPPPSRLCYGLFRALQPKTTREIVREFPRFSAAASSTRRW